MFSLHKNYIREQIKLVQSLQQKLVDQNVQFNHLADKVVIFEKTVPLFKKIAQVMAYYFPDRNMGTELTLKLLDLCEADDCNDRNIEELEDSIDQWEELLIRESLETPFHPDEISKDELDKEIDELRKLMDSEADSPSEPAKADTEIVEKPAEPQKSPEPPAVTAVQDTNPPPQPEQKSEETQSKPEIPEAKKPSGQKVVENFGSIILVDED